MRLFTLNGASSDSLESTARKFMQSLIKMIMGDTARTLSYILGSKMISHISALIASILIARHLGSQGRGVLAAILVIPTFISSFGHFGLPIANVYFMAKKNKQRGFVC